LRKKKLFRATITRLGRNSAIITLLQRDYVIFSVVAVCPPPPISLNYMIADCASYVGYKKKQWIWLQFCEFYQFFSTDVNTFLKNESCTFFYIVARWLQWFPSICAQIVTTVTCDMFLSMCSNNNTCYHKTSFILGHVLTKSNHVLENLGELCKKLQIVARTQSKPIRT
jgi:hypothetical protein